MAVRFIHPSKQRARKMCTNNALSFQAIARIFFSMIFYSFFDTISIQYIYIIYLANLRTLETIERSYFGGCFGLTFTWKNLENNKLPCFPRKLTVWLSRHGVYKAPRRTKCFTLLSSYFSRHPTISTPLPVTRTSSFHPRHFPPAIFISTCSRYSGQITDVDRNPRFDITSFQPREQFRFGVKILGIIPWRNLVDKFTNIFFFLSIAPFLRFQTDLLFVLRFLRRGRWGIGTVGRRSFRRFARPGRRDTRGSEGTHLHLEIPLWSRDGEDARWHDVDWIYSR